MAAKDYTGKICGCWKVIERDKNPKSKSHETFWISECQNCGNIASVRKTDLDKAPRSCNKCKGEIIVRTLEEGGYIKHPIKVGERFGLLVVLDRPHTKNSKSYCKCLCDCGNTVEVRKDHLLGLRRDGRTISCGCASESSGEIKIRQILEQENVNFQKQYRVKDDDNNVMVFDFVILDDNNQIIKCIEFNGKQHYEPIEFFGGEEYYQTQQVRDQRKRDWCQTHAIILQEIPYWQLDDINPQMLLSL